MPRTTTTTLGARNASQTDHARHEHRTARIIHVMGSSAKGFEQAIKNAIADASTTTRGITGAHLLNQSVKVRDGKITEYKVELAMAFGIERTSKP